MANGDAVISKRAVSSDGQTRTIGNKRSTVSIENTAARRRSRYRTSLILIGELLVIIRGDHLHAPELGENRSKDRADASRQHSKTTLEGNLRSIALPFRGARTRAMSGVVCKSIWIASHHRKRNQNGNHQDSAGDDDKNFSIHDMSP